jgi:NAD(P)-dependent dehydrogenase (short-subunit alcohol dehydrogenase family)
MIEYQPVGPDFPLAGKTAIITGGAAGIGNATAKFFAAKGANLVLADLNPEVDAAAKALGAANIGVVGDVTKAAFAQEVVAKADEVFGGADMLVNSAGIVALDAAESISEAAWDATMSVNLKGSFLLAQAFGQYLIKTGRPGSIVNLASQAGVIALDKHVAYCASKGGIIAMTKVLALEWGQYGIRVNCVSPTVVLTELGHKAWDGPAGEAFKPQIPAGRFAEPDEIAAVIGYLSSAPAAMITGHNLVIDGGYTIK